MSRRTLPRISAAALLLAVAAGPSLAQAPNPWRDAAGATSARVPNPWRGTGDGPRGEPKHEAVFTLGFTASGTKTDFSVRPIAPPGDGTPLIRVIKPSPYRIVLTDHASDSAPATPPGAAVSVPLPPAPLADKSPARLAGTWYREAPGGGSVSALTFAGDELKTVLSVNSDGTVVTVTLTADYAVTKDGTVHGVVTSADVELGEGKAGPEVAALSLELQAVVDQPFALRCRRIDGALVVSNVRCGGFGSAFTANLPAMLCGKYKTAGTAKVPTPKAAAVAEMTLPDGRYLEHSPQYYAPEPAVRLQRELSHVTLPPVVQPVCPTVPPEVLDIMVGTFGKMAGPPPVPAVAPAGHTSTSAPSSVPLMPAPAPLPLPAIPPAVK